MKWIRRRCTTAVMNNKELRRFNAGTRLKRIRFCGSAKMEVYSGWIRNSRRMRKLDREARQRWRRT